MSIQSGNLVASPSEPSVSNFRRQLDQSVLDQLFQPLYVAANYLSDQEMEQLYQAYLFAYHAHDGQMRNSGEPYITHPVAVACICSEWKLDLASLMSALLHDVVEDCDISLAEIQQHFGPLIADLVDGLTKLEKIKFTSREENAAESFRKMLLAMSKDVRVILIKLADRMHNMRTLSGSPTSKWQRISQETLDIYVPIAYRLGVNSAYRELRYLAFQYGFPWRFNIIKKASENALKRHEQLIAQVEEEFVYLFKAANIEVSLQRKPKELYSIYLYMKEKGVPFSKINDLCGFLVIVPNINDCYTALGILHQKYKPVPGKFKDHIAIPKVNGYQSLHTTLILSKTISADFQIQTPLMRTVAESGIVTNWINRINRPVNEKVEKMDTKWLQSLLDIQQENDNAAEFWEHIKGDLFPDSVYVFSPKGRIFALPAGSTPVDFAYAIHSDIGDRAIAAKINNEQAPLRTVLRNGDLVEIITSTISNPNPNWLAFVKTGRARSRIKSFIRNMQKQEAFDLGYQLLLQHLNAEGFSKLPNPRDPLLQDSLKKLLQLNNNKAIDELIVDIGSGKKIAVVVAKSMADLLVNAGYKPDLLLLSTNRYEHEQQMLDSALILDGATDNFLHFASCCHPIPGDQIIGHMTQGSGLMVHNKDCKNIRSFLNSDKDRIINVSWNDETVRSFETLMAITVINKPGILAEITNSITIGKADIIDFKTDPKRNNDTAELSFIVLVKDIKHIDQLLRRISSIHNVISAKRITNAR